MSDCSLVPLGQWHPCYLPESQSCEQLTPEMDVLWSFTIRQWCSDKTDIIRKHGNSLKQRELKENQSLIICKNHEKWILKQTLKNVWFLFKIILESEVIIINIFITMPANGKGLFGLNSNKKFCTRPWSCALFLIFYCFYLPPLFFFTVNKWGKSTDTHCCSSLK